MDKTVINIQLPTSWTELTDEQLQFVYQLIAIGLNAYELQTHCLIRFGGLKLKERLPNGKYLFSHQGKQFVTDIQSLTAIVCQLLWIASLPDYPVRIARIGRYHAVAATLEGVGFEQFLIAQNLYCGFVETRNSELLEEMAAVLYAMPDGHKPLKEWQRISIFYWFAALKNLFAQRFPHFFRPSANTQSINLLGLSIEQQLTEAMNAQIRALTKGDVTKEQQVLSLDTWRALTELDALAKEAEDFNRKYKK